MAQLVLGRVDAAVTTLEAAADADAGSPRYRADLAAAYVTRSERLGCADDLPRALSAAEAALQADPRLLEALFNKALVLEHLGLREDARDTWEEYLRHDGTSAWADELRARVPHRPLAAPFASIKTPCSDSRRCAVTAADAGTLVVSGTGAHPGAIAHRLCGRWCVTHVLGADRGGPAPGRHPSDAYIGSIVSRGSVMSMDVTSGRILPLQCR